MSDNKIPLGKAIRWDETDPAPTPAQRRQWAREAVAGWRKFARMKGLIEAEDSEIKRSLLLSWSLGKTLGKALGKGLHNPLP